MAEVERRESTAQDALVKATTALVKIEEHEKTCAERWKSVKNVGFLQLTVMLTIMGFLLAPFFIST